MLKIETNNAPAAIGPYSQAYIINDCLYTSGQIPVNPFTGIIPDGIENQTAQSCKNIKAILEAAGIGFESVFKTTCYLSDMNDFEVFNRVYEKFFISKPSRSCVAVKKLPKGSLCEIEAIAVISKSV